MNHLDLEARQRPPRDRETRPDHSGGADPLRGGVHVVGGERTAEVVQGHEVEVVEGHVQEAAEVRLLRVLGPSARMRWRRKRACRRATGRGYPGWPSLSASAAAMAWSCSSDWRMRRETCIWEVPRIAPISRCLRSAVKRSRSTSRLRAGAVAARVPGRRTRAKASPPRTPAAKNPAAAKRSAAASRPRRAAASAPRGQTRAKVLDALKDGPTTAGEIAATTGIGRGSASTTLTKLAKSGDVAKPGSTVAVGRFRPVHEQE